MGQCEAELHIADDHGDNHATMKCVLGDGHDGEHQEEWRNGKCRVYWTGDDRDE